MSYNYSSTFKLQGIISAVFNFFYINSLLGLYGFCYDLAQGGTGVPCLSFSSFSTHLLSVDLVFFLSLVLGSCLCDVLFVL